MTDRAVLLSIKPKYCELIASGKKTVEVRKTRPKIPTPFKCYIYCTKDFYRKGDGYFQGKYCGKVIGEFVCKHITDIQVLNKGLFTGGYPNGSCSWVVQNSALTAKDIKEYANGKGWVYGLHISDLKIYDKPKELSEFYRSCGDNPKCKECEWLTVDKNKYGELYETCGAKYEGMKPLYNDRPPQSWYYVQEVSNND